MKRVGVLAFHGDVIEHLKALKQAGAATVVVRTKKDLENLAGLILPGGESTTLYKLCREAGMWESMKQLPAIFGTCAGAIMLAKKVRHKEVGQESLGLMDITVDRNAYGRQTDSFEQKIQTILGPIEAVFIRAPRIKAVGAGVRVLAQNNGEIIAVEQRSAGRYYLAASFHPELTTTRFHEYWLKEIFK